MARGLIVGLMTIGVLSCSQRPTPKGKVYYQIPWPSASGAYTLQDIAIETLSSPFTLEGSVARIIVDPYMSNGKIQGQSVARFAQVEGNVFVPADFATLQATAVYAHHERLHDLDVKMGVADQLNWPLNIAIQANVVDQSGAMTNNALYDGRLDALLIVPYSATRLPISLNAGILAHEHFHKIFQTFVMNKVRKGRMGRMGAAIALSQECNWSSVEQLPDVPDLDIFDEKDEKPEKEDPQKAQAARLVYNELLLRALNEGLADFWGWVYSGDDVYFGRSLNDLENDRRRLDEDPSPMPSPEIWRFNLQRVERERERDGLRLKLAYEMGTYYARFMRSLALKISGGKESDLEARVQVAKALMEALPEIGESLSAMAASDQYISPNAILYAIYKKLPKVSPVECAAFEKFAAPEAKFTKPDACKPAPQPPKAPTPVPDHLSPAAKRRPI